MTYRKAEKWQMQFDAISTGNAIRECATKNKIFSLVGHSLVIHWIYVIQKFASATDWQFNSILFTFLVRAICRLQFGQMKGVQATSIIFHQNENKTLDDFTLKFMCMRSDYNLVKFWVCWFHVFVIRFHFSWIMSHKTIKMKLAQGLAHALSRFVALLM